MFVALAGPCRAPTLPPRLEKVDYDVTTTLLYSSGGGDPCDAVHVGGHDGARREVRGVTCCRAADRRRRGAARARTRVPAYVFTIIISYFHDHV